MNYLEFPAYVFCGVLSIYILWEFLPFVFSGSSFHMYFMGDPSIYILWRFIHMYYLEFLPYLFYGCFFHIYSLEFLPYVFSGSSFHMYSAEFLLAQLLMSWSGLSHEAGEQGKKPLVPLTAALSQRSHMFLL